MQVQGFAAGLAMLDDHESSGPPDGVESVYEGARYRKNKLGASGHATKDEKDEEQHKQRERESHKRVARHGRSFSAVRDEGPSGQRERPSGALRHRQEARRGANKRAPTTYGTAPHDTNGRPRSMDERVAMWSNLFLGVAAQSKRRPKINPMLQEFDKVHHVQVLLIV